MYRFTRYITVFIVFSLCSCYESAVDLIGEHANIIKTFDSLIVYKNSVYSVTPLGKSALLCHLNKKSDLKKDCSDGDELKIERTSLGNYIIQIHSGGSYKYALWMRSEPTWGSCLMWLGENVVGTDDSLASGYRYAQSKEFHEFSNKLGKKYGEKVISREQLLKIVTDYEFQLMVISGGQECLGEHAAITNNLIVIEGDSRHTPAFEPPH